MIKFFIILGILFGIYMIYLQIAALYRTRRLNQIAYQLDYIIDMMQYKLEKEGYKAPPEPTNEDNH